MEGFSSILDSFESSSTEVRRFLKGNRDGDSALRLTLESSSNFISVNAETLLGET